jgi:hypothetical protein
MPDTTITTNDAGYVALGNNVYQHVTLQSPGSDEYAEGTIMARKDVSDTIAVAYNGGRSSTFTAVATCQERKTLKAGNYVCTAGTLSSGVGRWSCADPDGNVAVFDVLVNTDDLYFPEFGLKVAISDPGAGTAFQTSDTITCTVAADGDVVVYDPDGTNGSQTPIGVLQYAVTVAGTDIAANIITGGRVNKNRLIIDDTTTVTDVHVQLLKQVGIFAEDQDDLSMLDNGAS